MHQRTWFSLFSLPLVAALTYPVAFHPLQEAPRREVKAPGQDPLSGLSDIQDVLQLIRDDYVDAPDLEKVIGGGIQAALERAHPLNAYLTPEDLRLPDPGPAGIGIQVVKRQIYAQVVGVVAGSPAAKAGIQPGDVIRKLDGESIGAMSAWTLERRLRGPVGSDIALYRYAAANGELKKITLKRELVVRPPVSIRREPKATVVGLEDLAAGRGAELLALLPGLDHKLTLVLDLRRCTGGELAEAARVAGLFVGAGPLAKVQETGKPDTAVGVVPAGLPPFARLAVLQGPWTSGAAEALASALKKQSVPVFGDRTLALGVERTRFLLRQGGAAEVVNRRWVGAGGEFLGIGGEKPEALKAKPDPSHLTDPAHAAEPAQAGVQPDHVFKNLKPEEDPLPRILEILDNHGKDALLKLPRTGRRDALLVSGMSPRVIQGPERV